MLTWKLLIVLQTLENAGATGGSLRAYTAHAFKNGFDFIGWSVAIPLCLGVWVVAFRFLVASPFFAISAFPFPFIAFRDFRFLLFRVPLPWAFRIPLFRFLLLTCHAFFVFRFRFWHWRPDEDRT